MTHDLHETQSQVLVVCGVSGSGKSTVGKRLAHHLGWRFIEGDDYHPSSNVAKMQRGEALNDKDRQPWLQQLQGEVKKTLELETSAILACSALQKIYRQQLCLDPQRVRFVFLMGEVTLLKNRLMARQNHFMAMSLLQSQIDILELADELVLDIDQPIEQIVRTIANNIKSSQALKGIKHDEQ
ncbi:MAG: gluconokinase [Gammaproteobacteria bacterium]|nr:gluconokinase [Gammaproteobacteria bacterium]